MDDRPRIISKVLFWGGICNRSVRGAIFCHVDKIRPVVRSRPCSTSGSQKCIGASPSFIARASVASVAEAG